MTDVYTFDNIHWPNIQLLFCGPQVSELDLQEFTSILGSEGLITDPHDVEPYNVDWLKIVRYNGKYVNHH